MARNNLMGDNTDLDSNAYVCTCLISALQTFLKHLNHMYHEFSICRLIKDCQKLPGILVVLASLFPG